MYAPLVGGEPILPFNANNRPPDRCDTPSLIKHSGAVRVSREKP